MVCSASRSPRVDIRCDSARPWGAGALADHGDEIAGLDDVTDRDADRGHRSGDFSEHRDLHLHRLQKYDGVPLADLIALAHHDLEHTGHDLGANILGHLHPTRLLELPVETAQRGARGSIEPHDRDWIAVARA